MIKKHDAERSGVRGISSRSPTEKEVLQALVTLGVYLDECGATSIALDVLESGLRVRASVTYGWENSRSDSNLTTT